MRPWLAAAVSLALALDAWTKGPGNLSEMLWACHWASLLIGLGLLAGSRSAVSAGLLFHLTLGIPAWLLGLLLTRELYPTSVLVHSLPPAVALLYLRDLADLPPYLALRAWVLHPAALAVSARFALPELNVNMAHQAWPPLAHLFPGLASFHVAAVSLSLMMLLLMERALKRWLAERAVERTHEAGRREVLAAWPPPHTHEHTSATRPRRVA
ncbi:MAG: hypothetical protein ACRD24_08390 [Terriglobales bacterium]